MPFVGTLGVSEIVTHKVPGVVEATRSVLGAAVPGPPRSYGVSFARMRAAAYTPRMADNDLRDQIKTMMVENLMLKVPKEDIRDDLPLFGPEGLGLDSIDALELVVGMERTFGVGVANSETARTVLASVNSIHDYIVANRKA